MPDLEPITREEMLLDGQDLEPITRKEMFIKRIYDKTQVIPEPITREEMFLKKAGDETTDVTIEQLNVSANGTYSESGKAYSPVIVNVPFPENAYLLKDIEDVPADIVTFDDGSNLPMPKLQVGIEPIQSGSGDPSPENIRPISGWSEANVSVTGKNLFDSTNLQNDRSIGNDGRLVGYGGRVATPNYITVTPNESIPITYDKNIEQNIIFIYALYNGDTLISRVANNGSGTVINSGECNHLKLAFYVPNETPITTDSLSNIQIEIGNEATTYEPYNGKTYNIQFKDGDNPLTVYGGTLDVVSGELTVVPYYASYNGETLEGEWISDRDVYAVGTTPTIGAQVVNIGATPQTYQLTPTQVKSLLGSNNVWTDTGKIEELEYFSKEV